MAEDKSNTYYPLRPGLNGNMIQSGTPVPFPDFVPSFEAQQAAQARLNALALRQAKAADQALKQRQGLANVRYVPAKRGR